MPANEAFLPELLVTYLQMVGIVAARGTETFMAALALVLRVSAQETVEDLSAFLVTNWTDLVRFDIESRGLNWHEQQLLEGNMTDLLVEAVCRMKNVQVYVRHLGAPATTSNLFGQHGPVHEVVEASGRWFAVMEPVTPWAEKISALATQQAQPQPFMEVAAPDEAGPSGVVVREAEVRQRAEADVNEIPEVVREEMVEGAEPTAMEEEAGTGGEEGESAAQAAESEAALERQATPPIVMQLEAAAPQEPPYEFRGSDIVCQLPGCPTPKKVFRTLKGWKLHASHTKIHIQQGFCTGCGQFVVPPPEVDGSQMKVWLNSHRKERCPGASKKVMKERRLEKQRLQALWRDASHIRLPDEEADDAGQPAGEQGRRAPKRAYATEDERRVGVCLAFIKRFKSANPARLDEMAADFDLAFA